MLFKKYLDVAMINFKTMGKLAFVPFFVIFGFIPFVFIVSYLVGNFTVDVITALPKLLLPMFSGWWILLFLREFIESDGNELLYVYSGKSQCTSVATLLIIYLLCESLLMGVCMIFYPQIFIDYIHLTLMCLLYGGFSYFFIFLTKSAAISFIPLLVGTILPFVSHDAIIFTIGFSSDFGWQKIFTYYLPIGLMGIVFFLLGYLLNKKFLKFN